MRIEEFTGDEIRMATIALEGMDLANNHCAMYGDHDNHAIQDDNHAYGCFYNALKALTISRYGPMVWSRISQTWPWGCYGQSDGVSWNSYCIQAIRDILNDV